MIQISPDNWRLCCNRFPYKIGLDLSGTVTAIGKDVNQFKVGDEVYGALKEANRGWCLLTPCVFC